MGKTMKMGFLESACRVGSEKSSVVMYLVKFFDHFQCSKKFFGACGAQVHNKCLMVLSIEPFSRTPPPPVLRGSIDAPPLPEVKNRVPLQEWDPSLMLPPQLAAQLGGGGRSEVTAVGWPFGWYV